MDKLAESLEKAYEALMGAAVCVCEANEASDGAKTDSTQWAAFGNFKHNLEFFRVSCEHAEELIDTARQRIGFDYPMDSHTNTNGGIPHAMRKAELQQDANPNPNINPNPNMNPNPDIHNSANPASGSHTPGGSQPGGGGFDARLGDDSGQ